MAAIEVQRAMDTLDKDGNLLKLLPKGIATVRKISQTSRQSNGRQGAYAWPHKSLNVYWAVVHRNHLTLMTTAGQSEIDPL